VTPEGKLDIVQSTVQGAAEEMRAQMTRMPELFQNIATDEILQELEQGITAALQSMNPRIPAVHLPRERPELTGQEGVQAGQEQLQALRRELREIARGQSEYD